MALVKSKTETFGGENVDNFVEQMEMAGEKTTLIVDSELSIEPIEWLVYPFIPATGLGQFVAPSNSGKTFVAIDLCESVVRGVPTWMGHEVDKHGDVVYVLLEGLFDFGLRISAWEKGHPEYPRKRGKNFWVQPEIPLDATQEKSLFELAVSIKLAGAKPVLVVVDTRALATVNVTNENDNREMGAVAENLKRFAREIGCTVLLVHHTPAADATRSRGATSVTAACDFEFCIDDGQLVWNKSKYSAKLDKALSPHFVLETVMLDSVDYKGRQNTSCFVRPTAGGTTKKLSDKVREAARAEPNMHDAILKAITNAPGIGFKAINQAVLGAEQTIRDMVTDMQANGEIEITKHGRKSCHFIVP